jgi:hypothetical protein
MMSNPEEIKKTIYAFIFVHSIGLISNTYYLNKNKKKSIDSMSLNKIMNYSLKLIIYFTLSIFVLVIINILPEGTLTVNHLNKIKYTEFVKMKDHYGSGFISNPNVALWLGIFYYFIMLIIQALQLIFRENSILEIFFLLIKKRLVK